MFGLLALDFEACNIYLFFMIKQYLWASQNQKVADRALKLQIKIFFEHISEDQSWSLVLS